MKRGLSWAVAMALLVAAAPARAEPRAELPPDEQVRALMAERLARAGGSGAIAVALLDRAGTRYLAVGRSDNPARPQVDEHTLFQIGSITKTFTAFLLAAAVRRGEVSLEDRLDRTLGDRTGTRDDGAGGATLLALATHTAGLPRVPLTPSAVRSMLQSPRDPYRAYGERDLDSTLAGFTRSPDRSFNYSNFGFALLGKALERAAGAPYPALLRERITAPLGLGETFVDVPVTAKDRVAAAHDDNGDVRPAWDLGVFTGAGALWSSASDMARYLDALRGPTSAQPAVLVARGDAGEGRKSGLAWVLDKRHDDDIVWHNGGTGGFRSFAGWSRRSGLGVVILMSTEEDVTDLGLHLLDEGFTLGRPQRHILARIVTAVALLLVGARLWLEARPRPESRIGKRLAARPLTGRTEAAARIVNRLASLFLAWHFVPWHVLGGTWIRVVVAVVGGLSSLVTLAQARRLPWIGEGGRAYRAKLAFGSLGALAGVAIIVAWWS